MLLRQELEDGVHRVAVGGTLSAADADLLVAQVQAALALEPRGVVVDLTQATDVADGAFRELRRLSKQPSGWPRAAVTFCARQPAVVAGLTGLSVHPNRTDAVRHIDDRSDAPRERVCLQHTLDSPAQARAAVATFTERLGLQEIVDDLTLVVSEMVTNAVRYAAPPVVIEMQADPDAVLVAVEDGSPERPRARAAGPDAEGGRGLMLVDLLAAEHGVRPGPPGKTVWALLQRRPGTFREGVTPRHYRT